MILDCDENETSYKWIDSKPNTELCLIVRKNHKPIYLLMADFKGRKIASFTNGSKGLY